MKCKVCGRTKEEIKEEFDTDVEMQEHQGIQKCGKCIREYKTMMGDQESNDSSDDSVEENKDWKEQVIA